jgi:hypothetical protein
MYVITPKDITESVYNSSSIAEPDVSVGEVVWNAATSYNVGDRVIRTTTHRVYQNLIAGVNSTLPENATSGTSPRWLDVAATNKWALFDEYITSKSTNPSSLNVVLVTGGADSIAFFETVAESINIKVRSAVGGPIVYEQTFYLGSGTENWYGLFSSASDPVTQLVVSDLPYISNQVFDVTFNYASGTVQCGKLVIGNKFQLGLVQYGASAGIIDYSKKLTDEFGRISWVKRANSRRMNVELFVDNSKISGLQRHLANLAATPAVWVGSEESSYQPLVVYGGFKDFDIVISYPTASLVSLEVEGLI